MLLPQFRLRLLRRKFEHRERTVLAFFLNFLLVSQLVQHEFKIEANCVRNRGVPHVQTDETTILLFQIIFFVFRTLKRRT